jgi:hypothetical protein
MMENDQSCTDTEITNMINSSLGDMDSILKTNDDYAITNVIYTIASADGYITVPDDFYKLRLLETQQPGSGTGQYWITLEQFSLRDKNKYNSTFFTPPFVGNTFVKYRVMLPYIYIEPQQYTAGTYSLWYQPEFLQLVLTTDTLPAYMDTNAWVEFAVSDVCAKIFDKQQLDSSAFSARAMYQKQRLEQDSATIDHGAVKKVADTRDGTNNSNWGDGWGWGF